MENRSIDEKERQSVDQDEDTYELAPSEADIFAEKALVKRLDLRILPIACLMYLAACAIPLFISVGPLC
jgi:hypothetical protein